MTHVGYLRRVALGVALGVAVTGALPPLASAAGTTTCTYTSSGGGVVTVNVDPNVSDVTLAVVGQFIAVSTDATPETACFGSSTVALTTNTNRIQVNANITGAFRGPIGYFIDESRGAFGPGATPESDGTSELETTIFTNAPSSSLTILGTPQRDIITVGGTTRGDVNFGADSDIDLSITSRLSPLRVQGGDGDDFISANGNPGGIPGPSTALTELSGGPGNDVIFGGASRDTISGGSENDSLRTSGGNIDVVKGGPGFDDAIVDSSDTPITGVESLNTVGRLRLAPRTLRTRAGDIARMKMSWTHPKAWRELRAVKLRLYDASKPVGTIIVRPQAGRVVANGAAALVDGHSRVTHRGKTVTAKLAMRLPHSLAGRDLRVDVVATDRHGKHQLERGAGTIRVRG